MKTYADIERLDLEAAGRGVYTAAMISGHTQRIAAAERMSGGGGIEYRLRCGHRVQIFGRKQWGEENMPCLECIDLAEELIRIGVAAMRQPAGEAA